MRANVTDEFRRSRLHPAKDRRGINTEPGNRNHDQNRNRDFAPVQIRDMHVLGLVERVEQNPLNCPEEICRGEDYPCCSDQSEERIRLERAKENEKLADKTVGSR